MSPAAALARFVLVPVLMTSSACSERDVTKTVPVDVEVPPLFGADAVRLPPPFAGLEFGMTLEQVKAVVPSLNESLWFRDHRYRRTQFEVVFDDTMLVTAFAVRRREDDTVAQLTSAWGPPQVGGVRVPISRWFNPDAKLRASSHHNTVEFTRYEPVVALLGEGPELRFQAPAPLLGLTAAELAAHYAAHLTPPELAVIDQLAGREVAPATNLDLDFGPIEWRVLSTPVQFAWSDDGKIIGVILRLDTASAPAMAHAEIFALLTKKWGEPTPEDRDRDGEPETFVFSDQPRIEARHSEDGWTVVLM